MKTNRFCIFLLLAIALGGSACKPGVALPTATPNRPAATATQNASGVRSCDFVPGKSQPASIPPGSPQPTASPSPSAGTFPQTPQEAASTSHQMQIFNQIVNDITYHYYAPDFNGLDWNAIQQKYKSLIQNGLSETDFARAMQQMVGELGDGVSYYASPNGQPTPTAAPTSNYAGIGVVYNTFTENGQDRYVLTWVYSGSPAEQAGLKIHDAILKVDGAAFLDQNGTPRTLGSEGTPVTISVQTPGQAPRDVRVVRGRISAPAVVDACKVEGTAIGYMRWFDINDSGTLGQTVVALKQMSLSSPLQGLILDLRQSSGSGQALENLQSLVGLFTSGKLGSFVAPRSDALPLAYYAGMSDISDSQEVPLIVIQDASSGSGPLLAGVLQLNGRARIVGQVADGEAYNNFCNNYVDGSSLCIANEVFQPAGKPPDYWKKTGIVPDVLVNGRWDQYREADDPYLAKAIAMLMQK